MQIRRARSSELNSVAELWRDCGLIPAASGFRNEMERKRLRDPDLFLVATEGAEILGAIMGGFDGRMAWVTRLAVSPAHRRKGIATQLVSALRVQLRRHGAPADSLLVFDDSLEGRRFWAGAGFEQGAAVRTWTEVPDSERR